MIWRGIAIGIIISAPMGPVGILCVQRTLEKGRRTGFFTGIGAVISDMFYCLLTGFGLSFIEEFLTRNHDILQLIGSVVLIGFGIYLFKSNPSRKLKKPDEAVSDKKNILNGFLFTFSNPLIIFLIIGLFARFNFFIPDIQFYHYMVGFIGIAAGAVIWWWVVTYFVAKLRSHFNVRSMWLINKIIGSIIFIFAIVGIVTAISEMASASPRSRPEEKAHSVYFNASRGFGDFKHASESALNLDACQADSLFDLIPLNPTRRFEFSFQASNLHNQYDKSYRIPTDAGSRKVKYPAWGIVVADRQGNQSIVSISTIAPQKGDDYFAPYLTFSLTEERKECSADRRSLADGVDLYNGPNAFILSFDQGRFSLKGGNREYNPILSWESKIINPDSIGFFAAPGALLSVKDISLDYSGYPLSPAISEYSNPDILETYLKRSTDSREGIWKIFDRTLEEKQLKSGGEYTMALIKTDYGYELYYLDGAKINPAFWKAGMTKARLFRTGFPDIFDVEWIDAKGETLSNDIKARYESPLFTFTFPYQSSTLRLRRLSKSR